MPGVKVQCIDCAHSTRPKVAAASDDQMLRAGFASCAVRLDPPGRGDDVRQQGLRARDAASMAKMTASDVALQAATNAFQIHGAYGVSDEYPVARYLRDKKTITPRKLNQPRLVGMKGNPGIA